MIYLRLELRDFRPQLNIIWLKFLGYMTYAVAVRNTAWDLQVSSEFKCPRNKYIFCLCLLVIMMDAEFVC